MTRARTTLIPGALALALAACSFNGAATPPAAGVSPAGNAAANGAARRVLLDVRLRIVIPAPKGERPSYVSASTQSLVYVITQAGASVPGGSGYVNLTPSSPQCSGSAPLTCTVTIPLQVTGGGTYAFALATYDAQQTGSAKSAPCTPPSTTGCAGNLLSQDLQSQNLVEGKLNTVAFTLGGIPAAVRVTPVNPGYLTGGGSGTRFAMTLYGKQTQGAAVDALDAGGNVIVGLGKPTIAVASADTAKLHVVPPSNATSNVYGLQAVASGSPAVVTPGNVGLTVTATPTAASGGTALVAHGIVDVRHKIVYVTTQGGGGSILEYFDDNAASSVRLDLSPLIWPLPLGGIATEGASPTAYVAGPFKLHACPPGSTSGRQCARVAGGLFSPLGVAADSQSNVYVANATGAILKCAPTSATHLTCRTTARFLPLDARGVAVDSARTLYVANPLTGRVSKCPENGTSKRTCSTAWRASHAFGVALDGAGTAYVTNPHSGVVAACAPGGSCTDTFSVRDAGAIALDAAGTAYVVDARDEKVFACGTACAEIISLRADRLRPLWIAVVPAP